MDFVGSDLEDGLTGLHGFALAWRCGSEDDTSI